MEVTDIRAELGQHGLQISRSETVRKVLYFNSVILEFDEFLFEGEQQMRGSFDKLNSYFGGVHIVFVEEDLKTGLLAAGE